MAKNPDNDLAAKMYFDGGYDACDPYDETDDFWSYRIGCDPGELPTLELQWLLGI